MMNSSSLYFLRLSLGALIFLFLFDPSAHGFKGDSQILTLKQKMVTISELHEKLSQKIDMITKMRQELTTRQQAFVAEVIRAAKDRNISSYDEAIQIPRIRYNLNLIQQLAGYTNALRIKMAYLKDATVQLEYYYQQIEDDIRIIETVRQMDLADLIGGINQTLDAYAPETEKHILSADGIDFYHPREVWRKIMAGGL